MCVLLSGCKDDTELSKISKLQGILFAHISNSNFSISNITSKWLVQDLAPLAGIQLKLVWVIAIVYVTTHNCSYQLQCIVINISK